MISCPYPSIGVTFFNVYPFCVLFLSLCALSGSIRAASIIIIIIVNFIIIIIIIIIITTFKPRIRGLVKEEYMYLMIIM